MSQRDLMRMTDDEVAAFLDEGMRMRVATFGPGEAIHLIPMSYLFLDGQLALWTDPGSQKVANLRRDPRISCVVDVGETFEEFRGVQIQGMATVTDDLDVSKRAGEGLMERYRPGPLIDEVRAYAHALAPLRVVVTITVERTISWDHRKLAGVQAKDIGR